MPHLVQMDKKYRDKGLTLVGADVQATPEEGIEAFAEQHKISFPLTKGTTTPPGLSGIPHMVIFNPAGEVVFSGHPSSPDAEKAIKDGLKEVSPDTLASSGGDKPSGFGSSQQIIRERQWTNTEGQTMTAAVVALDGETVTFRLKTGQKVPYDISKLSEADQKTIRDAAGGSGE